MSPLAPIFVPSKGRPGARTFSLLNADSIPHTLVVEPQDADAYFLRQREPGQQLLLLPTNDGGIGAARQFVLSYARNLGLDWFWQLDDDITGFFEAFNGHNVPCSAAAALGGAEKFFRPDPYIAQAALEYQQFAWAAKPPFFVNNSYMDVATCIHAQRSRPVNYRALFLKEDRDFALQLLALGWSNMRVQKFSFAAPKNGSNPGGCAPMYAQAGREEAASREMERRWPGVCEFRVKRDGRPDVKINWKFFERSLKTAIENKEVKS